MTFFQKLTTPIGSILEQFKTQILTDTIEQDLSCKNRNEVFQRKMIEKGPGF
jgi:hypothetical protein